MGRYEEEKAVAAPMREVPRMISDLFDGAVMLEERLGTLCGALSPVLEDQAIVGAVQCSPTMEVGAPLARDLQSLLLKQHAAINTIELLVHRIQL